MHLTPQERAVLSAMERMHRVPLSRLYPALSTGEGHLLGLLLSRDGGMTVSELSSALELPMPAVSRAMRSLEARGLISRAILPQDRRSILVTITDTGRQMMEEFYLCYHNFFEKLLTAAHMDSPDCFDQFMQGWNCLLTQMELQLREELQKREAAQAHQQIPAVGTSEEAAPAAGNTAQSV